MYGFQHVLAFYAGAVIVPILLANSIGLTTEQLIHLINADLFTCGIASIIQSVGFWKIGVRLPLLQGVTFTAVSPMIAIGMAAGGGTDGLLVIYGAVIVAGLFTFLIAPFFSKLIRFFPPVVTGSVITIIGIALLPVAAADAAGGAGPTLDPTSGKNLAYALGTLALIVLIQRVFKGFMATVAVLIGLVVGTAGGLHPRRRPLRRGGRLDLVRRDHAVLLRLAQVRAGRDHLDDRGHADHRRRDHR